MSWTFKEMHIYKFRLVRYRWWFVGTFVNKGFINVNCKEKFVFSPVLQVSKYTPTTWTQLGVQVHISNVPYCHYKFMLKPKMYVYHERLFMLST
jgi:hypothetical protein